MQEVSFVLDCSVTMAWLFEDEITDYTETILKSLSAKIACVPWIWTLEVANILLVAERKHRISHIQAITFKKVLDKLPIQIESNKANDVYEIAREFNLSAYDASYLALALDKSVSIATLDKKLIQAAKDSDVGIVQFSNIK